MNRLPLVIGAQPNSASSNGAHANGAHPNGAGPHAYVAPAAGAIPRFTYSPGLSPRDKLV